MKTEIVEITKTNALKAYEEANADTKKVLANMFKGQMTFDGKITDRVKTFEDACRERGLSASQLLENWKANDYSSDEIAYKKLKIIAKVLNEGWIPKMDGVEYRYEPYFTLSGSGFAFHDAHYWRTCTLAGSRLCFKNRELAEYAGRTFINEYKEFLL